MGSLLEPTLSWLEDPTVFAVNRLPAHSDHITCATAQEAGSGTSSLRQSLDGSWKFKWSPNPAARPADFWRPEFDDSDFVPIRVPGHMETQGWDRLHYINKLYDWDGHAELRPPKIDWDFDPVGSYVTTFDLNEPLLEHPVCVSFQGVEQAMYLWLNGHFVGYSEDSFTPSDFDLTPYIHPTGNRMCVEVYKRSSAAWLEDQDFFSFSGIFRSVYLYARPQVDVEDLWLKTGLSEDNTTGRLQLRLKVNGAPVGCRLTLTHRLEGTLFDGELTLTERDGFLWSQTLELPNIRLWDHGCPELYDVLLHFDCGGWIPYRVGFRRFEIRNKIMELNGKRLMLNGVNRHEWNPSTGRRIERADMERAMSMFRANNINAVRTCHYPNRTEWYHMCDENGIYMMDETNLETHGSWQKDAVGVDPSWNIPGSLPQWRDCVLDRANSMFQRDKNHVSILFWSCGNESYAGQNILDMANFFRAQDPSRVVHYEGCYWCREWSDCSDVESRMYATPTEIREYLENDPQKPYLNCEYMHNMGNSLGGMESYVRLGQEFPMYQGGFIWDYMDQALWKLTPWGEKALGYGGDFDDRQSDYAFSGNGIVTAEGKEKPCMQEVRYWYLPEEQRARWDAANRQAMEEAAPAPLPGYTKALTVTNGDGAWGVRGEGFEILFSKLCGGPVSLVSGGREWLWRAPKPALWRAPTENDLGCGFPQKSAVWNAVDRWQKCVDYHVTVSNENIFSVTYTFGADVLPDFRAEVTYRVENSGVLTVEARYFGAENRPELPLFGLRFETPVPVEKTRWLGYSGETYPDRYKGGRFGLHEEVPHLAPYLVPQECGGHTDTCRAELSIGDARLTLEKVENPYFFSAIPYTPGQLQEAQHSYELPKPSRTVITLASSMRGVGGIDSWGTDVEPAYRLNAGKDSTLEFKILL